MSNLTALRNIGRELARKLTAVGLDSPEKLVETGSKGAFLMLKGLYPQVCLVHLYALEGALRDVEFNRLPEETKRELKAFSDSLKGGPAL